MMFRSYRNLRKRLLAFIFMSLGVWAWQLAPTNASSESKVASYMNYNCEDFGTRERAQSEFNKFTYDKYGLDGDGDGQVCEWNPSGRNLAGVLSGVGLLLGRYFGKRKRFGEDGVVPLPGGLFQDWTTYSDGTRKAEFEQGALGIPLLLWWVPYFVMTILRDRVYSIDTGPPLLIVTCFVLGFGLTYWVASTKDNWI
jgi:hypothetical protein